ncbi:MAG: hypothetical protein L3J82_09110 [Planctomycetes bacterium]|nr:hypothetical protein [Planctomycetota bacterium]
MSERKTFIAKLLDGKTDLNQLQINRKVKAKFGKGISFVHIKALKEAHKKGKFDSKYNSICGDKKPAKKKAKKAVKAAAPKAKAATKNKSKKRGERRAKYDTRGRRDADMNKILLKDLNQHLVVFRKSDGHMSSENFKSRKRAEERVRSLVSSGVSTADIGYFRRTEIQAKVTL